MFLQRCPNCFSEPKLTKKGRKYFVECDGDCWLQTSKYMSPERAVAEWNSLKREEHDEQGD